MFGLSQAGSVAGPEVARKWPSPGRSGPRGRCGTRLGWRRAARRRDPRPRGRDTRPGSAATVLNAASTAGLRPPTGRRTARAGSVGLRPGAPRSALWCRGRTRSACRPSPAGASQSQITFSFMCTPLQRVGDQRVAEVLQRAVLHRAGEASGKPAPVTRWNWSCEIVVGQRCAASTSDVLR